MIKSNSRIPTKSKFPIPPKRSKGFTLIELVVVVIIIVVVAGVTIALMNVFFRGQGVRQGTIQCQTAFQQAKLDAADQRVVHFIVFIKDATTQEGTIEIHRDGNPAKSFAPNKTYTGDFNTATVDNDDPPIDFKPMVLPKNVLLFKSPQWVGVFPTGYCIFDSAFGSDIGPSSFDAQASTPTAAVGDIILKSRAGNPDNAAKGYYMCLDIDRGAGKIRRTYFYNPQGN